MVWTSSFGPAEREGGVDLGGAVARDVDEGVAGDRHQQVAAPLPVCSSMIVSVRWPPALAGAELLALLVGEAVARVAADEEVRRAGLVVGPVAARERVDLVDLASTRRTAPRPGRQHRAAGPARRGIRPTAAAGGRASSPAAVAAAGPAPAVRARAVGGWPPRAACRAGGRPASPGSRRARLPGAAAPRRAAWRRSAGPWTLARRRASRTRASRPRDRRFPGDVSHGRDATVQAMSDPATERPAPVVRPGERWR